jgi:hypothetical protein
MGIYARKILNQLNVRPKKISNIQLLAVDNNFKINENDIITGRQPSTINESINEGDEIIFLMNECFTVCL